MSVVQMHHSANPFSLEQRRLKQLLCLMFIYKKRHGNIQRAANIYSFTREQYHNIKYENSPFYKVPYCGICCQ